MSILDDLQKEQEQVEVTVKDPVAPITEPEEGGSILSQLQTEQAETPEVTVKENPEVLEEAKPREVSVDKGIDDNVDLQGISADGESPNIRQKALFGAMKRAGYSGFKQLRGFGAGKLRGTLQTGKGLLAFPLQMVLSVMEAGAPGSYDKALDFMSNLGRNADIPKSGEISNPSLLNYWSGAFPTEAEISGIDAFQRDLQFSLEKGGVPAQVAVQIATAAWQTSSNLLLAKAITGKLPGGATGPGMNWKATVQHAGKLAALTYTTTPGTNKEKTEAASMAFLYASTPAISMNIPGDTVAKLFDFALNSGITLASGQWDSASEQAKIMAENQGRPDEWRKFLWTTASSMVVSDLLFSLGTRSKVTQDAAFKARVAEFQSDPDLAGLTRVSAAVEKGDLSDPILRDAINNLSVVNASELGENASRSQQLKEMLEQPYKFNTTDELKKIAEPPPSVEPTSSRTLVRLEPDQRVTEAFKSDDIRFESKTVANEDKVLELLGDSVKRNTTITAEFKDGRMIVTKGVAALEAKKRLSEEVNVRVIRAVDSKPDVDPDVRAARAALDGRSLERPNIENVRKNAGLIIDTLGRSVLGKNREKQAAEGKKDQSVILEENIGRVLKEMDTIQHSNEDFGRALDLALNNVGGPANATQMRARILRTGTVSSSELDAFATRIGKTGDAPRRQLSMAELRTFAESANISLPGAPLKEKALIKDIMEVSNTESSPEQALARLNELNQLKGRPLITDIKVDVAGGKEIPEAVKYQPTSEETQQIMDSMPVNLKNNNLGRKAIQDTINQLSRPLPENPDDKRFVLNMLNKIALQNHKGLQNTETQTDNNGWDLVNKSNLAGSMRYAFGDTDINTGDGKMFDLYRDVDLTGRRSTSSVELRMKEIFDRAGLVDGTGKTQMGMKWYVLSHPEVGHAMKVIIGTNPDKSTAELTAARELIKADPNSSQLLRLTDSITQELQGVTATNVRMLQTFEFGKAWSEKVGDSTFGEEFIKLDQLGADRTPKQNQDYGKMKEKLDGILPMKNVNGKGVQVSKEDMIQADRIFKSEGKEQLRNHLNEAEWGTRKNYWMSESEFQSFGLEPVLKGNFPSFSKGKSTTKINTAGEINSRTGYSRLQEGDIFASLFTHMNKLQRQADTYHDTNALKDKLDFYRNEGLIPKEVYRGLSQWTESQWGRFQEPSVTTKGIMKANAAFWTLYPLVLARLARYSARNMMYQGAIYGSLNTHFRPGDVMENYIKIVRDWTDPTSKVRKYYDDTFKSDISQQSAIFFEQMLQADPGTATASERLNKIRIQRLWSLSAMLTGGSDTANRLIVGGTAYRIIDKHVNRFIQNPDATMRQTFDALKVNTMHLAQQRRLYNMFRDAEGKDRDAPEWETFVRELAEMKQENINFIYRIAGKSPAEQFPDARPVLGILTYPRGTYEELYRNGLQPIIKEIDVIDHGGTADWRAIKNGAAVLASSVVTHAIASAVAGTVIGEKDDPKSKDPKDTLATYSLRHTLSLTPGSPGMHIVEDFIKEGQNLVNAVMFNDDEQMKRSMNFWVNKGIYFTPMLPTLKSVMESTGNSQAARNIDEILKVINDMDEETQRNAWEKWVQKPIFGTADVHDERFDLPPLQGFGKRLLDSETMFIRPIAERLTEE